MLIKAEEAVDLVWYDCLQNVIEISALNLCLWQFWAQRKQLMFVNLQSYPFEMITRMLWNVPYDIFVLTLR